MKKKLIPFVAPEKTTIYSPPLKALFQCQYVEILAYIKEAKYSIVTQSNCYMKIQASDFEIEVEEKPQRMTYLQLLQLFDRGGWIFRNENGFISNAFGITCDLNDFISGRLRVSRIEKIEWIEPTTDLLD